jgi:hypothetical protein
LVGPDAHSDALSVIVRVGDTDILIDPGTHLRDAGAHNSIRIDGQNLTAGARLQMGFGETSPAFERVAGSCLFNGAKHMRSVELTDSRLEIHDLVELPPGEHVLEQFWHPGLPAIPLSPTCYRVGPYAEITFHTPGSTVSYDYALRSPTYGVQEETPVICVSWRGCGRAEFKTEVTLA